MNFIQDEVTQQVAQVAKDFANKHIKPNVMEWDESQHFPKDVLQEMGKLGLMGIFVPEEYGGSGFYQPLDLGIAKCRISVAVRKDFDYAQAVKKGSRLRVATKYVDIAREFFAKKGVHVDLIKLYGSMELAPLTGLADAIVDLVSTGNTLKANDLIEVEPIMEISSRLIVNRAAMKLKHEKIQPLIDAFNTSVSQSASNTQT